MNFKLYQRFSILGVLSVCLFACNSKEEKVTAEPQNRNGDVVYLNAKQAKNINLEVGETKLQEVSNVLKLSGQIDVPPQNLVSVSIPLGGYLKSTDMLPGTRVRKGQVLAIMEDPQYIQLQQDYLRASNRQGFAIKEYERQRELNSTKASSDKVLQQAESELKDLNVETGALAAKLSMIGINSRTLTANNISRTIRIYSPINGYVSKVNMNIGKYVTPSDVMFELINPQDIHLNLTVYEKDLDKVSIGQRVTSYTNNNPDKKFSSSIILVSHSLNENRSAEVHCHFDLDDKSLTPGMYMNAEIQLNAKREKVIPNDAIVNFENKDYVFVKESDSSFRMTPLQKGISENNQTVVGGGLDGKKVVLRGAYSLLMKLKNTVE
ncbi:efflux RND transporter periplasmic adaptor subunit [Pedobacter agri]|uniref:efflux RND transporter periplasmic adaptor subunit n=1 Tax=Pedobacter agri TaxID=454586 RepID=UPI0027894156|nr:efflux RND transporter periplasmic adaptor subunit [Pedobacter agri]MDQ1142921.1 cobalt-zinc-cadmium efflux system membrane fusion protein [Pedobacter agri]